MGGVLLILITIVAFAVFFHPKSPPGVSQPSSLPTTVPTGSIPTKNSTVQYNTTAQKKLIQIASTRPTLPTSDTSIREKLVASLGNNSGILYATSAFEISYVKAPDIFQVEILTTNVESAKQDTVSWFTAQGMSLAGICKLPLMFYLAPSVMQHFRQTNTVFNPLPNGC